ncbi:MAG TPA: hypothetical protein VIU40_00065 [Geobacteraceae bacterium]
MKLHNIALNNLRRRKAKMAFLTVGLMVGSKPSSPSSPSPDRWRPTSNGKWTSSGPTSSSPPSRTTFSLVAGLCGYAVGMVGARLTLPFMAEGKGAALVWDATVACGAVGLALALGLLASIYPALHASRKDPTEALRAL